MHGCRVCLPNFWLHLLKHVKRRLVLQNEVFMQCILLTKIDEMALINDEAQKSSKAGNSVYLVSSVSSAEEERNGIPLE